MILMVHLDPHLLTEEQISNDCDVVNDHHWCNRQPHALDTEDLAEIHRQQQHSKMPASDNAQTSSTTQDTVAAGVLTWSAQKF